MGAYDEGLPDEEDRLADGRFKDVFEEKRKKRRHSVTRAKGYGWTVMRILMAFNVIWVALAICIQTRDDLLPGDLKVLRAPYSFSDLVLDTLAAKLFAWCVGWWVQWPPIFALFYNWDRANWERDHSSAEIKCVTPNKAWIPDVHKSHKRLHKAYNAWCKACVNYVMSPDFGGNFRLPRLSEAAALLFCRYCFHWLFRYCLRFHDRGESNLIDKIHLSIQSHISWRHF